VSAGVRTWLHRLSIRTFRNLERVELLPPAEGLAVIGENGHGKSNLLEAIYYLQILRSFRGARDRELVGFGAPGFHLSADVHGGRAREVAVGFEAKTRRKRVTLDGAEPERLTDALGAFPAVIFSPQDAVLVSGPPSARRRYLDILLSLTSPRYLAALQRYRSALARRNAAMRSVATPRDADAKIAVWEPALAEYGARLWAERRQWVEQHAAHFSELCAAIGERGAARLRYASSLEWTDDPETALREVLERKRAHDIRRGLTHVGPHRDDLELTLVGSDGVAHDLRVYGSAGQQRTAAIALRLLEAATLRAHAGSEPLVLLDDPFAELDLRRATRILELLNSEGRGQTVLAVPRPTDIPSGLIRLERWQIAAGVLTPAEP
jgi:DNA replication and repair protein RecF